jgi:aminoglycoside phosphotransferase family enzyme/predicted kinase
MDTPFLLAALSGPGAYPFAVEGVEVRQTHISIVFLAGQFVYKIKKPVDFGFLDFSTLELRRHYCHEEVRLNRRLAPRVYLDVVGVTRQGDALRFEGPGEIVEWAVKMQRLPDTATFERRLEQGQVGAPLMAELGRRVAAFHAAADRGPHIAEFGGFDVVARNALENLQQAAAHVGSAISPPVLQRLGTLVARSLADNRALIARRAARGMPCDTHGDLRPEHVYLFPDRSPPDDIVVIDCIEFSERFRFADPISDTAFLVSELQFQGHGALAGQLAEAYLAAAVDGEGRKLLPFYTAYRAAVRGKVESIKATESEVPAPQRAAALQRARAYWLLALADLAEPVARPALILLGGLPGSGKSTLAAELSAAAGFEVIRSDVVRKELAGLAAEAPASQWFGQGIYSSQWNERTYDECLRRAETMLFEGRRVLIDASFRDDAPRRQFLDTARRWSLPGLILVCQADAEVIRQRLAARRNDASDADWTIYRQAAQQWQAPSAAVEPHWRPLDTARPRADSLAEALAVLREAGLF